MRCGEIREYMFAFLDNELDVPLSIEFQRHVELCHDCAREVEIEWAIKGRLSEKLGTADHGPPQADRGDQRRLKRTLRRVLVSSRWNRRIRRIGLPAAVAAAVIAALGVWLVRPTETGVEGMNRFADLLVTDFEHFLEEGRPLQIASADPGIVSQWLQEATLVDIVLPSLDDQGCKLVGGRKCKIGGRPTAFAVYDVGGTPASLVALSAGEDVLEGLKRVRHHGATHRVARCRNHNVVAARRGDLVYAAVSTLPEKKLRCLIMDRSYEGN